MRCSWGGSLNNFDGNSSVWNTSILWNTFINIIAKKSTENSIPFAISWVFIKIVEYSKIYLLGHQMMKLILPAHNIPDSILPLNPPADSVLASSLPAYINLHSICRRTSPHHPSTFLRGNLHLQLTRPAMHPSSQPGTNQPPRPTRIWKAMHLTLSGHFSWAKKCASLDVLSAFH